MIRIVVADDQAAVREALATMLGLLPDIDVVGTAADGEAAIDLVAEHAPDVVLMDLHMPRCDGVTATERLRTRFPRTKVVVLTTYADDVSVLAALRAGALGYLTKESGRAEIARALQAAAAGQAVLDSEVQQTLLGAAGGPATPTRRSLPDGLTTREGEVLRLIAAGRSNQEIAAELFVSEATVKTHINNLFAKAGVRDRAQAVRYAYQNGIVTDH
jgi:DNA-binding NarL/FixJ family response regulator